MRSSLYHHLNGSIQAYKGVFCDWMRYTWQEKCPILLMILMIILCYSTVNIDIVSYSNIFLNKNECACLSSPLHTWIRSAKTYKSDAGKVGQNKQFG